MAGASLLTLLDDIANVLDDVALMTKAASKKAAGVLGDDVALNAQQVTGVVANRELPVVWAVAKGSFINKAILVPVALVISVLWPQGIVPLLMLGGIYLCFEGIEKLAHSVFHRPSSAHLNVHAYEETAVESMHQIGDGPSVDSGAPAATTEKRKIKGAIRTDFILSAEIIAITLGTVAASTFLTQTIVVISVALIMTVGVYGFVAGVVKLDDAGLYLCKRSGNSFFSKLFRVSGASILAFAPYLMKALSIVGTAAMFLVGGGLLVHGIPGAETLIHDLFHVELSHGANAARATLNLLAPLVANALVGMAAGAVTWVVIHFFQRARQTV